MIDVLLGITAGETVLPDISKMAFSVLGGPTRYTLHQTMVNYKGQLIMVGGSVTGVGETFFSYLNGTIWSPMPKLLPEARMCHNTAVVGDKMYLWGGQISSTLATKMYAYDFILQTWEDLGTIPSTCAFADFCVIGTKFYYFGGMITSVSDTTPASFPSYEYNTVTKTWRNLNVALSGRANLSVAAADGKIYILGGRRGNTYLQELWCYDPITGTLTAKTPPPKAVSGRHQFVNYKGWLIQLFGCLDTGNNANNVCYRYHPTQDKWEEWAPRADITRSYAGCVVSGNNIYLFGGFNGSNGLSNGIVMSPTA